MKYPATEKQKKFLKTLLGKNGSVPPYDWVEGLSKKQAGKMISELVEEEQAKRAAEKEERRKLRQAQLDLSPPNPIPSDDISIPPEIREFKRWAREEYQNGQSILHLAALYRERFGNPLS